VSSYIFEDGRIITVGDGNVGPNIRRIYKVFTELQKGHMPAPAGWVKRIERVAP
jgi:branched-chain amino acid aminotransferase